MLCFFQSCLEMKVSLYEPEAFSVVSLCSNITALTESDGGRGDIATNKLNRETVVPASSSFLPLE